MNNLKYIYKTFLIIIFCVLVLSVCGCESRDPSREDSSFSINDFDFNFGGSSNVQNGNGDIKSPDDKNDIADDIKGNDTDSQKSDAEKEISPVVHTYNYSIGGTGTCLGAARFAHDVLSLNPDLVFIEFAINDVYSAIKPDCSKENLEYMVNSLYNKNPEAAFVIGKQ